MTASAHFDDESRRERTVALIVSILLHILIIGAIAWGVSSPVFKLPEAPANDQPLEFTIMPDALAPTPSPEYVRTDPSAARPDTPKNARFESDNNTRAATEAPPSGNQPLPSADGRDVGSLELQNRDYTAGTKPQPSAPQSTAEQPQAPEATTPPPTQLALREAPPKKEATTPNTTTPQSPPTAKPKLPSATGFQPETRVTRIRGNLSNRGKASLEAAATPLGRYKKQISDAIGSRWYYYVNNQIGLLNIGTVSIRFVVLPNGKVRDVRVTSNSSNESFASVSINAIIEAEIPPIPDEVAKLLENGRIEIDYSFTILSN
jgi:outer membrane biosynthesis protein TonB